MDPTTQNILRECADRLIQTADLIARSSPSTSTTTASTAAPAIAASTSTTASSFQSNSAPSAVSTARAEHARLFGYRPPAGNPRSRPNNRDLTIRQRRRQHRRKGTGSSLLVAVGVPAKSLPYEKILKLPAFVNLCVYLLANFAELLLSYC